MLGSRFCRLGRVRRASESTWMVKEFKTEARGPGSLIYEPYALVHQWGNPGNEPLIFLAFNINPEGVAAVLAGAPAKKQ